MSRYPPVSRPASDFGRPAPRRAARLAAALGARPAHPACLPRDLAPGPVDVLCPRPLHHVLEYEALYGFLAALRSGGGAGRHGATAAAGGDPARRRRVRVFLRSALADWSPFARLPADEVGRLPETGEAEACAQLLRRLAASAAASEGAGPEGAAGAACLLLGPDPGWENLAAGVPGLRRCDLGPEFRWRLPAAGDATRAADDFFAALQRSSPRWLSAVPGPPPLASTAGAARRAPSFLLHQGRSHLGDMLWLTPLLRTIAERFPGARVTVAGGAAAAQALANSPHCAELLQVDPPPDGSLPAAAARAGLLDRLRRQRFDAALFAFASRPQCRWLAEAAAELEIPWRVDLEYFEGAGDGRRLDPLFTHQGWFFWGTLPSPRLLLHLLDPLAPIASTAPIASIAPTTHGAPGTAATAGGPEAPLPDSDAAASSGPRLEYFAAARWRQAAADRLASHGRGGRPFAVLAPGARSSERWPPRKFAALARRLAADLGFDVLIEGGPADAPVLDAVAEHLGGSLPALPADAPAAAPRVAVYQDPLGVLAALLERASLLVSNDSASIHLAEACAAPTLYFAHREKLTHSHPAGPACWALFDAGRNRLARITVDQAMAAIAEMVRLGEVRRVERVERGERGERAGQVERVETRLAGGL